MNHHPKFKESIVFIDDLARLLIKYVKDENAVNISHYIFCSEQLGNKEMLEMITYFQSCEEYKSRAVVLDFIEAKMQSGATAPALKDTALYLIEDMCLSILSRALQLQQ